MFRTRFSLLASLLLLAVPTGSASAADSKTIEDSAARFGIMPSVTNMRLSPDGQNVSYLDRSGARSVLHVASVATGKTTPLVRSNDDMDIGSCRWLNADRLACSARGQVDLGTDLIGVSRLIALDKDGGDMAEIGQRSSSRGLTLNQFSGGIIDLLPDDEDHVLMEIDLVPEYSTGTRIAQTRTGLIVQRVNIHNNRKRSEHRPIGDARSYQTDGRGNIRVYTQMPETTTGGMKGEYRVKVRDIDGRDWTTIAEADVNDPGYVSVEGFSEDGSEVYTMRPYRGRQALFKQAANGSGAPQLVFAHDRVDVDELVTFGRWRRPVGYAYTDEYHHIDFFDPELEQLDKRLTAALGGEVTVSLIEDSWDGGRILLSASSDRVPGDYYVFDKGSKQLIKMSPIRPYLADRELAVVRPVSYPATDGTRVPAYLTLDPKLGDDPKGLPLIVMPHGGPSARDYWGFDWLAQYFASLGYAVIQPNYRGSSGFGADWSGENALRGWKIAIDDINDSARWAISSGLADPEKTAIVGWSYGGYAALQGGVVDPDLYKAIVAIAPVTDFGQLIEDARGFTNYRIVRQQVGSGPHVEEGSPRRHADRIKAPVQIYHGDEDLNVNVTHGRRMADALERTGKLDAYVEYDGLEHSLMASKARADMLQKIGLFLKRELN